MDVTVLVGLATLASLLALLAILLLQVVPRTFGSRAADWALVEVEKEVGRWTNGPRVFSPPNS